MGGYNPSAGGVLNSPWKNFSPDETDRRLADLNSNFQYYFNHSKPEILNVREGFEYGSIKMYAANKVTNGEFKLPTFIEVDERKYPGSTAKILDELQATFGKSAARLATLDDYSSGASPDPGYRSLLVSQDLSSQLQTESTRLLQVKRQTERDEYGTLKLADQYYSFPITLDTEPALKALKTKVFSSDYKIDDPKAWAELDKMGQEFLDIAAAKNIDLRAFKDTQEVGNYDGKATMSAREAGAFVGGLLMAQRTDHGYWVNPHTPNSQIEEIRELKDLDPQHIKVAVQIGKQLLGDSFPGSVKDGSGKVIDTTTEASLQPLIDVTPPNGLRSAR